MNFVMLGNSTYSARWGHTCNFSYIQNKLPFCTDCWKSILAGSEKTHTCDACLNWETDGASFAKPKKYPKWEKPEETMLQSKKITYESLRMSVKTAVEGMSRPQKKWTKEMVSSYFSTEGINGELLNAVCTHVKEIQAARKIFPLNQFGKILHCGFAAFLCHVIWTLLCIFSF